MYTNMPNPMKTLFLASLTVTMAITLATAQEIKKDLRSFDRIITSPHINLVLKKGDKESIRLVYEGVDRGKINIDVTGKTLHLFLDNARILEKSEQIGSYGRRGIYRNATVTAYVTYRSLEYLEMRGTQTLTCRSPLSARTFTLKLYGENEVHLASLHTKCLRTSLYGQNKLEIRGGKAAYQKYKVFGENKIDTKKLQSNFTTASIYGESEVMVNTQDELRINSFGVSEIQYSGDPEVNKRIMIGESHVSQIR